MAILLSAVLAVGAALVTPPVLRSLAPAWTVIDKLAAVITAEVYLAVLIGHLVAFGGWVRLRDRLRVERLARELGLAVAVSVAIWVVAATL